MEKQELAQMIEQMLGRLDASMNASQAKADKTLRETLARMEADNKAWREKMRAETEAIQAETEAI
jgi:hypothetical protein